MPQASHSPKKKQETANDADARESVSIRGNPRHSRFQLFFRHFQALG
jgi:hypothetical protein